MAGALAASIAQRGVGLSEWSAESRPTIERWDVKLKVRFYGKLADVFGTEREIAIDAPCSVTQLRSRLAADHPQAAETLQNSRVRACVDDTFVSDEQIVSDDQVLELLAPVSGG